MTENRQCFGCSYAGTPNTQDNCNYCGMNFKVTDLNKGNMDMNSINFKGLLLSSLDLDKLPKTWKTSTDIIDFLKCMIKCVAETQAKIWSIGVNEVDGFYVVMSGNTYESIHEFLLTHKHLQLMNVFNDQYIEQKEGDEDYVAKFPMGTIVIVFQKI